MFGSIAIVPVALGDFLKVVRDGTDVVVVQVGVEIERDKRYDARGGFGLRDGGRRFHERTDAVVGARFW